jgi:hypothetical protein
MVKFDPETAENNPDIEKQWAVVSLDYALTYLDLLIKFGKCSSRLINDP